MFDPHDSFRLRTSIFSDETPPQNTATGPPRGSMEDRVVSRHEDWTGGRTGRVWRLPPNFEYEKRPRIGSVTRSTWGLVGQERVPSTSVGER